MSSRLITATVAVAGVLAGCSGSESATETKTKTPAEPVASSSAPAPASAAPATRKPVRISTAAPAAPVTGTEAPGSVVDRHGIVAMAKKVGCRAPTYKKPKRDTDFVDVGVIGAVACEVGPNLHTFVLMKPRTSPEAAALVMKDKSQAAQVPYLRGKNWGLFVPSGTGERIVFAEPDIKEAQRKIGAGEAAIT